MTRLVHRSMKPVLPVSRCSCGISSDPRGKETFFRHSFLEAQTEAEGHESLTGDGSAGAAPDPSVNLQQVAEEERTVRGTAADGSQTPNSKLTLIRAVVVGPNPNGALQRAWRGLISIESGLQYHGIVTALDSCEST